MRKILLGLLLLSASAAAALWWSWGRSYELVLSEEQIAQKLAEKFPFEKTYLFLVTLRFEHPRLTLVEGEDRLRFGCDMMVSAPVEGKVGPIQGAVTASAQVRYVPDDGTFFLDEPRIDSLDVTGVPEKWVKKIRSSAEKAASELLKHTPIYRLKPTDLKHSAARMVLKGVTVREQHLVVTLALG